jgi:hypothetical protein
VISPLATTKLFIKDRAGVRAGISQFSKILLEDRTALERPFEV